MLPLLAPSAWQSEQYWVRIGSICLWKSVTTGDSALAVRLNRDAANAQNKSGAKPPRPCWSGRWGTVIVTSLIPFEKIGVLYLTNETGQRRAHHLSCSLASSVWVPHLQEERPDAA